MYCVFECSLCAVGMSAACVLYTTAHVRCLQAANNLQMQASPQTGVCKVLREIQGKQVLAKRGVCKPPTIFR